jgi:predicted ATPase/class 3 adenylate cyclase/DNA-binding CsgD family transcriptional regulator
MRASPGSLEGLTGVGEGEQATLPAGVVTFLLSDVEGSTRLWQLDEDLMASAIARHYELLDAAVTRHGGVRPLEQGEGDSVVAAFDNPAAALASALEAQRAFATEAWPEGCRLRIRIAVHTGDAQLREDRFYVGRTVIRCARLRAVAHGGQTVLSGATRDLLSDQLPDGATARDLGFHRLKDLSQPERVWQLCHPDLPDEFPPLRSLNAVAHNLPVQLTSFVGREAEIAELQTMIDGARLVTLTGAGGSGKTRLALHAAAAVADRHRDGVWWVELAPVSSPDSVAYAVARAVGLVEEEGKPVVDTLCEQLAASDAMLVLDNCEHVLEPCARLVDALLRSAPDLHVVATSREPLGVPGEATWRVPSLDEDAAVRLFGERAAQVRPGFVPDESAAAIAEICLRLDGLPLAIELAAARVRMMAPERIAAALEDRFRLLTGGGRTVLARQRTLEASVAWSHDLLDLPERVLLRRLSVFAGGFTLEAAEAVCATEPLDRYDVLDLLARLVDKSLVQADIGVGDDRYRLLETIRFFARERLVECGEGDAIRERHRDHYLAFAERAEPELVLADGPRWLDRLEEARDDLDAALAWCDATAAAEPFLRLVTALTFFFELHGHLQAGGRWFARALAHEGEPSILRARALWGSAHVALYGDDYDTLFRRAPEALAMAREVGDEWALGRALNTQGLVQALFEDDPAAARERLHESIALGREHGDSWAVADGLKMLTVAWMVQDDFPNLAPDLAEFRRVADELGNRFFIAWCYCTMGYVGMQQGDFGAAEQGLLTALEQDRELGGAATAGFATAWLGAVEALTGRYEAAEARLGAFLERASAVGDGMGLPIAVVAYARLLVGLGRVEEATALLDETVKLLRPLGLPWYVAPALSCLGAAQLLDDDDAGAEASLHEAHRLGGVIGNPWVESEALRSLARLARRRGEDDRAEDLLHDALARCVATGLRPGVVESLEVLAAVAAERESGVEAARLYGAASAMRAGMGLVRWPVDEPVHAAAVAQLRATLGGAAFDEAWDEGEALSAEDAVSYASRARGERKRPSTGWASLTPTELKVVTLVAEGLTNPEIGERLFIGRGTVKTHVAHVFTKLGLRTRAELAAEATRRGL